VNELAAFEDNHFEIAADTAPNGDVVILGCAFIGSPTFDDWLNFTGKVKTLRKGFPFIMGDLLAGGEARWGEKYAQAVDETDYDYDTLAAEKYTCEKIPLLRRRKQITHFSYYRELAPLPVDEQEKLMDLIEAGEVKTREQIREYKRQRRLGYVQDGWALAMERDALANENSGLRSQNGKLTADLATARERMAAIEAEAAVQCATDPGTAAREAYERDRETEEDEDEARRVVCPECGAIIEVIL
jgi:hypothetical protein